jgi:hypothetical protein
MVDWSKELIEETSKKPAYFIGRSSEGAAVVEYCANLYFVDYESGIRHGTKILQFINPKYKYVPYSLEDLNNIFSLEGKVVVRNDGEKYRISLFFFNSEYFGFRLRCLRASMLQDDFGAKEMCRNFILEDTGEPVGKKVRI